jgi:hypothetical protein
VVKIVDLGHANEAQCVSLLDGDGDNAEVGGESFWQRRAASWFDASPFPASTNASEILSEDDVG